MVPDSLSWGKAPIANNPVRNTAEKQKVVTLGDKILLFAQNNEFTVQQYRQALLLIV